MLGYLLKYVFQGIVDSENDEIIVITDKIPFKRKMRAIEKSVKIKMKSRILAEKTRQEAGRDFANIIIWRMPCSPGKLDVSAQNICDYLKDLGIFLRWDGRKQQFNIHPHWRKYLFERK